MINLKFRKRFLGVALILGLFSLSSCSINLLSDEPEVTTKIKEVTTEDYSVPTPQTEGDYQVTYVCNNGFTYISKTTGLNKVLQPDNPSKVCSTFLGWYKDEACTQSFDFTKSVHEDTFVYAKWDTDLVSLVNEVSTTTIKSNIRIWITNYDKTGFGPMATMKNASTSLGSGVIFYESNGYYYALTNNHVVYTTTTYQTLTLEDAYETKYEFDILAKDAKYDLAIIRFKKGEELEVASIANYTVPKNEVIFAMGEPNGLSNTVSMGYILGNKVFTPDSATLEMSNVTFSVYINSAPIDSGSSGGALIDSNLRLVGINFASAVDQSTGDFKYTYTIPIERVREFITSYTTIKL